MSEWKNLLADVDDDYLIGLSNKGIVKRAHKDMEGEPAVIKESENEAMVMIGGETCTVKIPLGDSVCTCPSRTICRHVIRAILELKRAVLKAAQSAEPALVSAGQDTDGLSAGENQGDEPHKIQEAKGREVAEEIAAYPLASIRKVLGARRYQALVRQAASGIKPEITVSSTVTVRLPGQEATVKLLAPLAYSTCTCHKKELCEHKAAAILWCQLRDGVATIKQLEEGLTGNCEYDLNEVREAAGQMKLYLEELLDTGLARMSPDAPDELERLAVVGHNAGLARFEGYFRSLSDSCKRYQNRMASFRIQDMVEEFSRLYKRVTLLLKAAAPQEIGALAGEFKSEYVLADDLDLIGITAETFKSKSGYEGETWYFLEPHQAKWYTYTNARPVFYEQGRSRRAPEKATAPWGLPIPIEAMERVRIHLTGAKVNAQGRISSGASGRGEITGERSLVFSEIEAFTYAEFSRLYEEEISRTRKAWLWDAGEERAGRYVFLAASRCGEAVFDETQQIFRLPLFDCHDREVVIWISYSQEEAASIRYLERLAQNAAEAKHALPYFFGSVYLKDGRIRMYPMACFDGKEIAQ